MSFNWDAEKATLLLRIPEIAINRKVVEFAEKNGFIMKPEFHLTIISFQNGKKLIQGGVNAEQFDEIQRLAESVDWHIEYLPEYFILERTIPEFILGGVVKTPRHTRRSIIQIVRAPDLHKFFEILTDISGIDFDKPIEHVTLFSWSDYEPEMNSGIAVNSQADFDKYLKDKINL
jgi:hypothetical protein